MVTKLQVQGAGKPPNYHRRQLILGFSAGLIVPVGSLMASPTGVITVAQNYMGARLLQRVNQTGMPEARSDTFGAMKLFVFPTAVAATAMDIYIVDPGLGALLRYDPMLDAMAVVAGARVSQQSRLAALPDGSVILANGNAIPATRFSRSGRIQQTISPQYGPAFFDDVVADSNSGRLYGLDRVQGRLEEILPHGRGGIVLPPGLLPDFPIAMAMDGQRLYVAGRACGCVEAIDLFGSRGKSIVAEDFGNIVALAANDGWLVIADSAERQVRIYREGILLAEPDFSELRLVNPLGMAIVKNRLYVADTGNRRIASFILRP